MVFYFHSGFHWLSCLCFALYRNLCSKLVLGQSHEYFRLVNSGSYTICHTAGNSYSSKFKKLIAL